MMMIICAALIQMNLLPNQSDHEFFSFVSNEKPICRPAMFVVSVCCVDRWIRPESARVSHQLVHTTTSFQLKFGNGVLCVCR